MALFALAFLSMSQFRVGSAWPVSVSGGECDKVPVASWSYDLGYLGPWWGWAGDSVMVSLTDAWIHSKSSTAILQVINASSSAKDSLFALDTETGLQKWTFGLPGITRLGSQNFTKHDTAMGKYTGASVDTRFGFVHGGLLPVLLSVRGTSSASPQLSFLDVSAGQLRGSAFSFPGDCRADCELAIVGSTASTLLVMKSKEWMVDGPDCPACYQYGNHSLYAFDILPDAAGGASVELRWGEVMWLSNVETAFYGSSAKKLVQVADDGESFILPWLYTHSYPYVNTVGLSRVNLTDGLTIAAVDMGRDEYGGFDSSSQSYVHVSADGSEVATIDWSFSSSFGSNQATVRLATLSSDQSSASSIQMDVPSSFWLGGAMPLGRFDGGSYFMIPNGLVYKLSVDRSSRVANISLEKASDSFGYGNFDFSFGRMTPDGDIVGWNGFTAPPPSVQFWQMKLDDNTSHAAFGPNAIPHHAGMVGQVTQVPSSAGGRQAWAALDMKRKEMIVVTVPFGGDDRTGHKVVSMHFACMPDYSSGLPMWAVACIVAGSCVVVAGVVLVFLRKRRAKRMQEPLVTESLAAELPGDSA